VVETRLSVNPCLYCSYCGREANRLHTNIVAILNDIFVCWYISLEMGLIWTKLGREMGLERVTL